MINIDLEPAFVLHVRPYRETSLLVDLFTSSLGRISAIARGAKRPKSPWSGLLQPFREVLVSAYAQSDLFTLKHVESLYLPYMSVSEKVYSALYLNELMMHLTGKSESLPDFYAVYKATIHAIVNKDSFIDDLRFFEWQLLTALGYAPDLHYEHTTNKPIREDVWYRYVHERGLECISEAQASALNCITIQGSSVFALLNHHYPDTVTQKQVKRFMQQLLKLYLGEKPLMSRALWQRK